MTVESQYSPVRYQGTGQAVTFPFLWSCLDPAWIHATITNNKNVDTELVLNADYSVHLLEDSPGGSVTLKSPLAIGSQLTLWMDIALTQDSAYKNTGNFNLNTVENAFDKSMLIAQMLKINVDQCIKLPITSNKPPDLLAQEIFDARDSALTSAANAAVSEAHAEAAAAETLAARDTALQTITNAGSAALGEITSAHNGAISDIASARTDSLNAIDGARTEAVKAIADLADTRTSQFTTLADSKTVEMQVIADEHIRNINTTGDTKLTELNALSGNMTTIANQAMADVVAEGDRQEARQQVAASSGVTAILLKGDEQENRLTLKGSEIILEATAQAQRAETEADRAEDAANRAVDMTGVGLASKTNFGLARAGSGIDVDEAGVFSVKFPRVVSTPTCTFVADAGIGYSYTLSMSARTGAAEGFITQFRVFVDDQPEQIVSAVNNTASLTITVQGLDLQVGTIVVSAEDNYQNPSNDHVLTYIKHAVSIQAPRILQPAEGSTDVALSPALTLQALVVTGLPATPEATQILVATTEDFAAPLYDTGEIAYTVSHTVPKMLPDNSNLYMKARHKAQFYGWSAYGPVTSLTTIAKTIVRPAVISPPNASAGQSLTPTIVATAMASTGIVDVPVNTQVQVSTALDFAALAFDTGESAAYATSVNVPTLLAPLTAYYVRLRHKGNELGWSPWSLASSFTTLNAFVDKTVVTLLSAITGGVVQTPCPSLSIAAFANVGPVDTASNTQVQIATNATFAAPTFDTGTSHGYARTISSTLEGAVVGGVKYDRYLAPGTTYFIRARHRGTLFGWGNWSDTVSFTTLASYVTAPEITAPAEGSTTTTLRTAFTFSAYRSLILTDAPLNTRLQVSASPDFAVNLIDTGDAGVYTTAFTPGADLPLNTRLYVRARHKGSVWGWSPWSGVRGFTTVNAFVNAPVVTYPTNNATGVPLNVAITTSAFSNVGPVDTPEKALFQIATDADFSNIIINGWIPFTISLPVTLAINTQYWVRTAHWGVKWGNSGYGPTSTFRTIAASLATPSIISPANGATNQPLRPTLTFSDPVVVGQTVTGMQVTLHSHGTVDAVFASGLIPYAKTYTITADLPIGRNVNCYVQYFGSVTGATAWSNALNITTITVQELYPLGTKWSLIRLATWAPPKELIGAKFALFVSGGGGGGGQSAGGNANASPGRGGETGGLGGSGCNHPSRTGHGGGGGGSGYVNAVETNISGIIYFNWGAGGVAGSAATNGVGGNGGTTVVSGAISLSASGGSGAPNNGNGGNGGDGGGGAGSASTSGAKGFRGGNGIRGTGGDGRVGTSGEAGTFLGDLHGLSLAQSINSRFNLDITGRGGTAGPSNQWMMDYGPHGGSGGLYGGGGGGGGSHYGNYAYTEGGGGGGKGGGDYFSRDPLRCVVFLRGCKEFCVNVRKAPLHNRRPYNVHPPAVPYF